MPISGLGSGIGAKLAHTVISPSTTTISDVIQVLSVAVSGQTCDVTDISSSGSTSQFSEFLPGLKDAGSITLTVRYGSSLGVAAEDTFDELQTLFNSREIGIFEILIPGTATSGWKCNGFITRLGIALHYKGGVQQQIVIKCTGVPTFTKATA